MFDEPSKLVLGLFSGLVFGFLLQKGRVARYEVILAQLRLHDWTVLKVMATAVAVGSVGIHLLAAHGMGSMQPKPAVLGALLLGGLLFGVGLAVLGYCPGTTVAACGQGNRDAVVGVFGMMAGAALYVALGPSMKPALARMGDWGKVTLPDITATPALLWVGGLVTLVVGGIAVASLRSNAASSRSGPHQARLA